MTSFTEVLNITTPSEGTKFSELTTALTDSNDYRIRRDYAVNISNGIAGLLIFTFNLIMLLLYILRPNTRKNVSFMMLQVFIFCALQGLDVGTVFVFHRVYRYSLPIWYCVIGDIFMQYLDDYILMLLPLLAIERLIYLRHPFLSKQRAKKFHIISLVIAMGMTLFTSIIPLIPAFGVPESMRLSHDHPDIAKRRNKFYFYFSCQGYLNKRNVATPIIMLILQISCVVVVVGIYIKMYFIAKHRLTKFSGLTIHKRKKLRKAAVSVLLVALVFFITTWPYGLIQTVRNMCNTDYIDPKSEFCQNIGLELRFVFGVISHLGFLFAPLLFTLFNPKLRKALREFLHCGTCKYHESQTNSSSNNIKDTTGSAKVLQISASDQNRENAVIPEEDMPYTGHTKEDDYGQS